MSTQCSSETSELVSGPFFRRNSSAQAHSSHDLLSSTKSYLRSAGQIKIFRNSISSRRRPSDQVNGRSSGSAAAGSLLLALPREIAVEILKLLSVPELLYLRRASRAFKVLIDTTQYDLTCSYMSRHMNGHARCLFPVPSNQTPGLSYMAGIHHRKVICARMADHLATWVICTLMRKKRDKYAAAHKFLSVYFEPHLLGEFSALENIRRLLLGYVKWFCVSAAKDGGASLPDWDICTAEKVYFSTLTSEAELWDLLETHNILYLAFAGRFRPPAYAGTVERTLRGWSKECPPVHDLAKVILLGGLREVERVWSSSEVYSKRRKAFDEAVLRLSHPNQSNTGQVRSGGTEMESTTLYSTVSVEHKSPASQGMPFPPLSEAETRLLLTYEFPRYSEILFCGLRNRLRENHSERAIEERYDGAAEKMIRLAKDVQSKHDGQTRNRNPDPGTN